MSIVLTYVSRKVIKSIKHIKKRFSISLTINTFLLNNL